ncbi:hypothetical protein O181_078594 [Austropuccinia psidii MF-1]|uniref:Uncharacterized protein n=1 Tax=Austropuccinia psidii MF-1 TaxID=1389203 RepID=A0A9Q3FH81_9BASI|nr:hypothetical protein [Austropuccinia psidii MF-1]
MSSKLTELTDSPFCTATICSLWFWQNQLAGFTLGKDCFQNFKLKSTKCHFFFVGKKPCCHPRSAASNVRRYLWSKKDGPLGKEFQVSECPTPDATSGYSYFTGSRKRDVARWAIPVGGRPIYSISAVPISRINTEGVVKIVRRISNSPPDADAEGSDELDGEEVEVVNILASHKSRTSPYQPPAKRFQSRLIPSTPGNLQPTLATIPT